MCVIVCVFKFDKVPLKNQFLTEGQVFDYSMGFLGSLSHSRLLLTFKTSWLISYFVELFSSHKYTGGFTKGFTLDEAANLSNQ